MAGFAYRALSPEGQETTGNVFAASRSEAILQIRRDGFLPIEITTREEKAERESSARQTRRFRARRRDIPVFTRQMAALLAADIPIDQSLSILHEQTENKALADVILEMRQDITGGASLSEAFAKHPQYFSKLYCNMVKIGETGGVLDSVLKQLSAFMSAEQALRSSVVTALAYPAIVVAVGCLSVAVLVFFVIPKLSLVFADFGADLPLPTKILIETSHFLIAWWWLLLGIGLLVFWGLDKYRKSPAGKAQFDRLVHSLPGIGTVLSKAHIARFSRTMGTLTSSGIPVLQALSLVYETTTSQLLANALRDATDKVQRGEGLSGPLRKTGQFPPMVVNLIAVGEETGTLDKMLLQVAENYDVEVEHAIKRFITLFEPVVIILIAIGVGSVIVSFLLPILRIGEVIQ
ncbi:MAG: type II secretion system F family protein [bacterium]